MLKINLIHRICQVFFEAKMVLIVLCVLSWPVQANGLITQCELASKQSKSVEVAIQTCRQELTQEHSRFIKASILSKLGQLYRTQNEAEAAIAVWQEAGGYVRLTQMDSTENKIWVKLQALIAETLFNTGQTEQAESYLLTQISEAKLKTGLFSITVAKLQESLGGIYALQGDQDNSLKMFQESALIYQMQASQFSLDFVENQMSYGIALLDLGLQEKALTFFKEFSGLLRTSEGYKNSILMAEALTFLGTLQIGSNAFIDAARNFHDAYSIRVRHFGHDELQTTQVLNNLGVALFRSGYLDKAQEILNQAYDTRNKLLGAEDSLTQSSKNNLNAVIEAKNSGKKSKNFINIQSIS